MTFGLRDDWQAFHSAGFRIERERTGREEDACPVMVRVRAEAAHRTVGEGLHDIAERRALSHLRWIALFGLHLLDQACRRIVVEALARIDPPSACIVYLRRADLSDEEDGILWDGFAPTMTVMQRKIEAGAVRRAKDA